MDHHGVAPADTLMVGYDFVDQEAASRAGVDYIDQKHMIGVEMFDCGFGLERMSERFIEAGTTAKVQAPGAFAAVIRSKSSKEKAMPRSPAKRKAAP